MQTVENDYYNEIQNHQMPKEIRTIDNFQDFHIDNLKKKKMTESLHKNLSKILAQPDPPPYRVQPRLEFSAQSKIEVEKKRHGLKHASEQGPHEWRASPLPIK